jgi:hypothetical protein
MNVFSMCEQPSVYRFFLDQQLPVTSDVVKLWFSYLVYVHTFGESPNSVVVCSRHVYISGFLLFSCRITKTQLVVQMFVTYHLFNFYGVLVLCVSKQKTKSAL